MEEEWSKLRIVDGVKNGGWSLRSKVAPPSSLRVSMKRRVWARARALTRNRAPLEGSRIPRNGIKRRVKTLKKLIPSRESGGLSGLFRDTADYILTLQMKVRVMQVLVKALSSDEEGLNLL